MFGLDALHLARAQFAFTMAFHIIFPAFSIGLASYLAVLEALWLLTKQPVYLDAFRYWLKIFAVGFAMGVVSGIVMSYQFGTNWSRYSDVAGPVVGPLMAYEVLTAFFLESGFLGVMLFGMSKVGPRLHMLATGLVAFGTLLSGFWIISVNSWMQTPAGYKIMPDGRLFPTDYWRVIFNPSVLIRFTHMILASYLSVAFVVGAVAAWHLLRGRGTAPARLMFSMALWMAAIVAPIQIGVGDTNGIEVLHNQPAKLAAMEAIWTPKRHAPELLFGIPDMKHEVTRYKVGIPYLGSLILTHSLNGKVPGMKEFPRQNRPDSLIIFWTFRFMVAIGFLMFGVGLWSLWLRWKGRLYDSRWLQRMMLLMAPSGFAAVILGWTTTEVGRQPWTVYGVLRTADSLSPIAAPGVGIGLLAFVLVYFTVFGAGILILLRMMAKPPETGESEPSAQLPTRAAGITPGPSSALKNQTPGQAPGGAMP